jgi:hypothetical protein
MHLPNIHLPSLKSLVYLSIILKYVRKIRERCVNIPVWQICLHDKFLIAEHHNRKFIEDIYKNMKECGWSATFIGVTIKSDESKNNFTIWSKDSPFTGNGLVMEEIYHCVAKSASKHGLDITKLVSRI